MKIKIIQLHIIAGIALVLLVSCSTVGQYLPITQDEIVIGTIQTNFIARNTWLSKKGSIDTHIYLRLLEAAVLKYSGDIDVKDIIWVTGRKVSPLDTEISATGKVIRINSYGN